MAIMLTASAVAGAAHMLEFASPDMMGWFSSCCFGGGVAMSAGLLVNAIAHSRMASKMEHAQHPARWARWLAFLCQCYWTCAFCVLTFGDTSAVALRIAQGPASYGEWAVACTQSYISFIIGSCPGRTSQELLSSQLVAATSLTISSRIAIVLSEVGLEQATDFYRSSMTRNLVLPCVCFIVGLCTRVSRGCPPEPP